MISLLLDLLNNLVMAELTNPAFFDEAAFRAFVNAEIVNGEDESDGAACDVWRNLVRLGGMGNGVEINRVLDLIDTESRMAMHAVFGSMEALL